MNMAIWISKILEGGIDFEIILFVPELDQSNLSMILLPWQEIKHSSTKFNYDSLKYYPGIIGLNSIYNLSNEKIARRLDNDAVVELVNSKLKTMGMNLSEVDYFCFTSEHPILLQNSLNDKQLFFYFEHGFGDYILYLNMQRAIYKYYAIARRYIERKTLKLYRSSFVDYFYISSFGHSYEDSLFDETILEDKVYGSFIDKMCKRILNNDQIIIDQQLDLTSTYFLVSLDQIEFLNIEELSIFVNMIYEIYINEIAALNIKTILLFKPREDTSQQMFLNLTGIVSQLDDSRILVYGKSSKIKFSADILMKILNVNTVFTHGYSIKAFALKNNMKVNFYNLNKLYYRIFGFGFYYKKRFAQLRFFRRHHNSIERTLYKYYQYNSFFADMLNSK